MIRPNSVESNLLERQIELKLEIEVTLPHTTNSWLGFLGNYLVIPILGCPKFGIAYWVHLLGVRDMQNEHSAFEKVGK